MIYTKNKTKNGTVVRCPVTAENTFTRCAKCGKEIQMDLRKLILAKAEDPYNAEVNCAECTKKMIYRDKITPDTMVLLSAVMNGIGFGEELHRLCDAFDVDDICEVDPEEYEMFIDELFNLIEEVRNEE